MSNLNYYYLQKAIYEKLTGNSSLMAIISDVFDYPPQSAIFPFISIGNANFSEVSSLVGGIMGYLCDVNIYAREAGHKQTADIMEIIYGLLHNGAVSISGKTLVMMRFESSSIKLQDDGWTYQGIMRLKVILQNN